MTTPNSQFTYAVGKAKALKIGFAPNFALDGNAARRLAFQIKRAERLESIHVDLNNVSDEALRILLICGVAVSPTITNVTIIHGLRNTQARAVSDFLRNASSARKLERIALRPNDLSLHAVDAIKSGLMRNGVVREFLIANPAVAMGGTAMEDALEQLQQVVVRNQLSPRGAPPPDYGSVTFNHPPSRPSRPGKLSHVPAAAVRPASLSRSTHSPSQPSGVPPLVVHEARHRARGVQVPMKPLPLHVAPALKPSTPTAERRPHPLELAAARHRAMSSHPTGRGQAMPPPANSNNQAGHHTSLSISPVSNTTYSPSPINAPDFPKIPLGEGRGVKPSAPLSPTPAWQQDDGADVVVRRLLPQPPRTPESLPSPAGTTPPRTGRVVLQPARANENDMPRIKQQQAQSVFRQSAECLELRAMLSAIASRVDTHATGLLNVKSELRGVETMLTAMMDQGELARQ